MGTVNAQAAPPALKLAVGRREQRDVTEAEAEAPAIDRKENDIPPCDRNAPKDRTQSSDIAEPKAIETPASPSGNDTSTLPAPAYLEPVISKS